VALETASTVAAPLSIAVLTLSLVTARQIHANTPSPLLSPGLGWLGYPNFSVCARAGRAQADQEWRSVDRRAAGSVSQ
jgi:hypothetical protein